MTIYSHNDVLPKINRTGSAEIKPAEEVDSNGEAAAVEAKERLESHVACPNAAVEYNCASPTRRSLKKALFTMSSMLSLPQTAQ
jgi:hypothetical protein